MGIAKQTLGKVIRAATSTVGTKERKLKLQPIPSYGWPVLLIKCYHIKPPDLLNFAEALVSVAV